MKRKKILIAAANWTILCFLDYHLTGNGYNTACSWDGIHVFPKLKEFNPEVVILDANIKEADCLMICRYIKEHKADRRIIILASQDMHAERFKELELEADACVTRPVELKELLLKIKALLEKRRGYGLHKDLLRFHFDQFDNT
ncbi:MAG: response regulator [Deltaproteobacteria bacterium]|nr:response regulator [Deltaproteobacteria bacterium]